MSKFEEFKEFCKTKPFLIEKIHKKETTWQELYEIYDIYGKDADIFNEEGKKEEEKVEETSDSEEEKKDDNKKETSNVQNEQNKSRVLDLLGNFDPDKLADGLNGVKKILAVLGEVTKPEENEYVTKRKMTRPYQRSDD